MAHKTTDTNQFAAKRLVLLAIVCFGMTGCASMIGKTKGPLDDIDTKSLKAAGYTIGSYGAERPLLTENGEPCVVLDITDGKRHLEKLPIQPGQALFVSDVIHDAQLHKKIGRMKASVLRPNGKNRPPVRLDVDFDDSGKNVMEGQNYSLRAGDQLVVRRDEKPLFAESLKSFTAFR